MIKTKFIRFFAVALMLFPFTGNAQAEGRIRTSFDFDWKFTLGDVKEAASPGFNDAGWEDVQLPHDWSIKLPIDSKGSTSMGFLKGGIGWYRKSFKIPADYRGKTVRIMFDGVYHKCDVYLNGKHLGFHPYGYIGFEYNLTPYLIFGASNTISVRVNHADFPSSRWYSGSGIYRHTWLTVTNPVQISTYGTSVTTPKITRETADVKLETRLENNTNETRDLTLQSRITDDKGHEISTAKSSIQIHANESPKIVQLLVVQNPALWSVDSPALYRIETTVQIGNQVVDNYLTSFGIRSIRFDPDKGFFLNGEHLKLKGMCLHQDAGLLGTAVPDRSYERRLEILKEYGCNAIRCSHNPPAPEFLDLCDRMGFVVIDEAFDKWKSGYYAEYFDEWWKKDLDAMLQRDKNHPSIIMWSVGNEVKEQNDSLGVAIAKMFKDYVHLTELTRPVTLALRPNKDISRTFNTTGFTAQPDVVGYNYQEPWMAADKAKYPGHIMYVSEAYPYYSGRSDNHKDYNPVNPWYFVAKNDFVLGQFIWAGVDYLGESAGWPSSGWSAGLFDICMTEKSRAAFHRAMWTTKPMVRIAVADQSLNIDPGKDHWSWPNLITHWNFSQYEGHVIEVQTITNCDSVELWLNDVSLGKRSTSDYTNNTIVWHVPYKAGRIQAKGYIKGLEAANFELKTSGKPARILLSADKNEITADGQDLSHITITIVDANGIPVPDADRIIAVEVGGNAKLLGIDNGDQRRKDGFGGNNRTSFFGKALTIVQSLRQPGAIKVKVSATGLPAATISLLSK